MTLIKRASNLLFIAATTGAVIGLSAAPAMAATTLKVKVSNGGTYTATASKTVLKNGNVSVTCTSTSTKKASKATGTVATATHTGTSPVKIGTVKTLAFNHCSGPLGVVHTTIMALPYSLKVDSTTNSSGQTDGMITGTKVHVSMTGCSFDVTGSAPAFYTNGTHKLTVTKNLPITPLNKAQLTISNVSAGNCGGLVNNGDHPTFTSTYTVSRHFTIKSTKV
jgi:hypothetical protein